MNRAELTEKLQRLENSADGAERHSLALELSDTRDRTIFETVLRLSRRDGLEPIIRVKVVSPEEYLGDVIGDINRRGGSIEAAETCGGAQLVVALVPLAKMFGYAHELGSLSHGRAQFTAQFSHYGEGSNDGGPPDTEPAAAALRA